jgi:aminoglycoside 6'-N-acetyltransferase
MTDAVVRPRLIGPRTIVRPGGAADLIALRAIRAEPSVTRWWGEPDPPEEMAASLLESTPTDDVLLVVEVADAVAGGIQYGEETEPDYRHASIDIYLSESWQGRGIGSEAVRLLARFLVAERHHHRLTIDPAADNKPAIRCYERVGFRPVGIMRQYERGPDGTFHDGLLMDLLAADLDTRSD